MHLFNTNASSVRIGAALAILDSIWAVTFGFIAARCSEAVHIMFAALTKLQAPLALIIGVS
jgi:hypothetical protein